LNFASSFGYKF
jgi:magnesium-transporting ATPase (P-type)